MIPPPPGVNLALGKPADQSSVGGPSRGRAATEAAAGAVNGRITGAPQMHTETERCPWWSVDLQLHARIREIRIFDGAAPTDCIASGLRHFFVEVSADGGRWDMVHAKVDDTVVSGADGSPLIVVPDEHTPARFVRIASVDEGALHLDQVEVYGDPVGPAVVAAPPPVIHAGRAAPVVHVEPRGGFGNQMVQYMVAAALAARVPGCLLSNVDLPRWNVKHPPLEPGNGPVLRIRPLEMRLEVEKLAEQLGSGRWRGSRSTASSATSATFRRGRWPPGCFGFLPDTPTLSAATAPIISSSTCAAPRCTTRRIRTRRSSPPVSMRS